MTAIEPFKPDTAAAGNLIKSAVGGLGEAFGSVLGSLGGGSRTRAAVQMHQDQMLHEANMQQQHHENTLETIDHMTNSSMKLDTHQSSLRQTEQSSYVSHAKSLLGVVQPGTQTEFSFGGGSFKGVSALPVKPEVEGSSVGEARDRRKALAARSAAPSGLPTMVSPAMPSADAARAARLAAKVSSNVKNRTQFPEPAAVEKPEPVAAKAPVTKTRKKSAAKVNETVNLVTPGEQYND